MKWLFTLVFYALVFTANAHIKPANGLWGTIDDPAIGSGLMMTTQNGVSVVSVFTYDESGQNVWYIGSGKVNEEGVFESELIESENGQNILVDNPQSATFVEQRKNIRIEFQSSQLATMKIGEAEPKLIQPNHYAYESTYGYPDLIGKWVIADKVSNETFILDLKGVDTISPPIIPGVSLQYESKHPSTQNWRMICVVVNGNPVNSGGCALSSEDRPDLPSLNVEINDIGSQYFKLTSDQGDIYQAFRLDQDSKLLPNDGLWRPADDPAIGSGMAMRTQGDYTVVLLYTYDDEGHAVWQNAAGKFDENGKMVAELYTPNNGTAIESNTPSSAEFEGEPQALTIQLIGMEIAEFSIDGSTPKIIQNLNFASELYDSEQFIIGNDTYQFPDQEGKWVGFDNYLTNFFIYDLRKFSPNATISPPNPYWVDAQAYIDYLADWNGVKLNFEQICPTVRVVFDGTPEELRPYCEGWAAFMVDAEYVDMQLKTFFEDISFDSFRTYYEIFEYNQVNSIDRTSNYFQFFRLE